MAKKVRPPLAERLRASARAAHLTSDDLAARLGVSPSTVRVWWTGRNEPPVTMLAAYAEAVSVSVEWLVTGKESWMDAVMNWVNATAFGAKMEARPALDRYWEQRYPEWRESIVPAMRDMLNEMSGGDWSLLTPEKQRAILEQIVEKGARGSSDEGERPEGEEGS